MDHPIGFARSPGYMAPGERPKTYDKPGERRRCRCGAVISTYTKGEWCLLCADVPDRQAHYLRAPKETTMEPAKLKAAVAAKTLGVNGKDLKDLERAGRIEPHERGRGLFGSTYLESDVLRLKAELEAEQVVAEAAHSLEDEPELASGGVTGGASTREDGCYSTSDECCNQPDNCQLNPNQAETREATIDRKIMEHTEVLREHVKAAETAGFHASMYRNAMVEAQATASRCNRLTNELAEFDIRLTIGVPTLVDEPDMIPEDPEIRAMYLVREALQGLERDAQIRVMRWATARFGIDRPLPKADEATSAGKGDLEATGL